MHFTDTEIKDFKQICFDYTSELIDIEHIYDLMYDAQYELEDHYRCHFDGEYSDTAELVAFIDDCKKRIKRLERFEIWLEQNHGI